VLVDGKQQALPTDDATSVRVRALADARRFGVAAAGEAVVALQIAPEPRLRLQRVLGVRVQKAVDDRGQKLSPNEAGAAPAGPGGPFVPGRAIGVPLWNANAAYSNVALLRLKKGEKAAKSIKEVQGSVALELLDEARPMVTVEKVAKAAGKTVEGAQGGTIKVLEVKEEKDQLTVRIELQLPAHVVADQPATGAWLGPQPIRGGLMVKPLVPAVPAPGGLNRPARNGMSADYFGLSFRDAKGKALPTFVVARTERGGKSEVHLVCQKGGREAPAQLVFTGRRQVSVNVPFTLKDVPMP
jgi:hypothetical protein